MGPGRIPAAGEIVERIVTETEELLALPRGRTDARAGKGIAKVRRAKPLGELVTRSFA